MRAKIKELYCEKIRSLKLSSAIGARKLALKLRAEYSEIKLLVDFGYEPEEAIEILKNFNNLILEDI